MTLEDIRAAMDAFLEERTAINAAAETRFADSADTTEVRGAFVLDAEGNPTSQRDPLAGYTQAEAERMAVIDAEEAVMQSRLERGEALERAAQNPRNIIGLPNIAPVTTTDNPYDYERTRGASRTELRGQARTAIEQIRGVSDDVRQELTERVETVHGSNVYRYTVLTSSDEYRSAFFKSLSQQSMTDAERNLLAQGNEVRQSLGLDSGQLVPVTLDRTLIQTSDIELNPMRMLADVRTTTTPSYQYNTIGGMTASDDAEREEVSDDTPGTGGDTITVKKAQAFGKWTWENLMDMPEFEQGVRVAISEAKDDLEAARFLTGTGGATLQVEGVLTGMTGAIADVNSSTAATIVEADIQALIENAQNRHRGRSVFVGGLETKHLLRLIEDGGGNRIWAESLRVGEPAQVQGAAFHEASLMDTPATTGNRPLMFGNFASGYRIVDRVGMTLAFIPELMGANGLPTGESGIVARWRYGAGVVNPNAIRVLALT